MKISVISRLCPNRFRRGITLALSATLAATLGFSVSHAQLIVIVNTGTALGTATSWTVNTVPSSSNSAIWNSTSTVTTGADTIATTLSLGNIDITNVTHDVTISGGTQLNLGNTSFGGSTTVLPLVTGNAAFTGSILENTGNTIDMSLATGNLTISTPLNLIGPQTWSTYSVYTTVETPVPGADAYFFNQFSTVANKIITLNITAAITGSQGFTETGNGTINLDGASPNLLGQIKVFSGNLNINNPDAFGPVAAAGSAASLSNQLVIYGTALNGTGGSGAAQGTGIFVVDAGGNIGTTLSSLTINTPVLLTSSLPLAVDTATGGMAYSAEFDYNFVGPGTITLNAPIILSANLEGDTGNVFINAPGTVNGVGGAPDTGTLIINSYIMPGAMSVGNGTTIPTGGISFAVKEGNVTVDGLISARGTGPDNHTSVYGNLTIGNGGLFSNAGPTGNGGGIISVGSLNLLGNSIYAQPSSYNGFGLPSAPGAPDSFTTLNVQDGFFLMQEYFFTDGANTTTVFNQNGGLANFSANNSSDSVTNAGGGEQWGPYGGSTTATGMTGIYNFNGGLNEEPGMNFYMAQGNVTVNMNGGTWRPTFSTASYFATLGAGNYTLVVQQGGAIFDTAGLNMAWADGYEGGQTGVISSIDGISLGGAYFYDVTPNTGDYPSAMNITVQNPNGHPTTIADAFIYNLGLLHPSALGPSLDGGLTKEGLGNLTIIGTVNTYNGPTTILGGNLTLAFQGLPLQTPSGVSTNIDGYGVPYALPTITPTLPLNQYTNVLVTTNPFYNILGNTTQLVMDGGVLIVSGNSTQGVTPVTFANTPVTNIQGFPGTTLVGNATLQIQQTGDNIMEVDLGNVTRDVGSSLFLKTSNQSDGYFTVRIPNADTAPHTVNGISLPASTGEILTSNNLLTGTPYATAAVNNGDDWAALASSVSPTGDGTYAIVPLSTFNTGTGGTDSTSGNSPGYHITTPTTLGGTGALYANPNADMTSATGQVNPYGNPIARTILQSSETLTSLRFLNSQSSLVNLDGDTFTVGGILYGTDFGAVGGGISNGFIQGPPGGDTIVIQNDASPQTISATILNNPVTVGGVTTGSGFTKAGGGELILNTNANTYTGFTTVDAGTLVLNGTSTQATGIQLNGGSLSFNNPNVLGGGILNLNSGSLINNGGSSFALNLSQINATNIFSLTGPGGPAGTAGATATIYTGNAPIDITGNIVITVDAGRVGGVIVPGQNNALVMNGTISGPGILTLAGLGNVTLGGANTFSGGLYVEAGNLTIANAAALGTGPVVFGASNNGSSTLFNGPTITTNGPLSISTDNAYVIASQNITYSGSSYLNMGPGPVLEVPNLFSSTGGPMAWLTIYVTNPTGNLEFDGGIGGAPSIGGNLTLGGAGTLNLTNAVDLTSSFPGLHLNVTGSATLELSGDAYLNTETMFTVVTNTSAAGAALAAGTVEGGTNVIGSNVGDKATVVLNNTATWIAQMTQPTTNTFGGTSNISAVHTNVNGIEIGANQYYFGNSGVTPTPLLQGGAVQGTLIVNDSANVTTNELFIAEGFGPMITGTAGVTFSAIGVQGSGGYTTSNPTGTIAQQDQAYGTVVLNGGTILVDNFGTPNPTSPNIYTNGPVQPISNIFMGGYNDNNNASTLSTAFSNLGVYTGGGNLTNYTRYALLELNGGTLATYGIYANDTGAGYPALTVNGVTQTPFIAGNATIIFNGGILTALANNPEFIYGNVTQTLVGQPANPNASAILNLLIGAGGANINTNGFNIGIPVGFAHDTLDLGATADGGLTVTGNGNLTLGGGAGATNSYTGPTSIQAGTLIYNTGSIAGAATVLPGQITGTGNLTTAGINILDIDGVGGSTFTGTLQLNSGTVELDFSQNNATSALIGGAVGTPGATLQLNGGTLQVNGGTLAATQTFLNTVVTGTSILELTSSNNAVVTLNLGTITDPVSTIIDFDNTAPNGVFQISNPSASPSLANKALANTVGTPFATVNGGADWAGVGAGTTASGVTTYPIVALFSFNGVGGNPANILTVNGANGIVAGDNTYIGGSYASGTQLGAGTGGVTAIPTLTINSLSAGSSTFDLGGHTLAFGGLLLSSGVTTGQETSPYTFTDGTMTAEQPGGTLLYAVYGSSGSGDLVVSATINNNPTLVGGVVVPSNLNKVGTGTLDLNAANGYTGTTTISGGKLQLDAPVGGVGGGAQALMNSLLVMQANTGCLTYQAGLNNIGPSLPLSSSSFSQGVFIGGISGTGDPTVSGGGLVLPTNIFTLSPIAGTTATFSGVLADGGGAGTSVQMDGAATGTEVLTQGQGFKGNLIITQGNLILAANQVNMSTSATTSIIVNGGSLTLNGTNAFAGQFALNGGTLNLNNPDALGTVLATYLTTSGDQVPSGSGGGAFTLPIISPLSVFTIGGGSLDNTSGGNLALDTVPLVISGSFGYVGTGNLNTQNGTTFTTVAGVSVGNMTITTANITNSVTINVQANTLTLSNRLFSSPSTPNVQIGVLAGGNSLTLGTPLTTTVTGAGTLFISGNNANLTTVNNNQGTGGTNTFATAALYSRWVISNGGTLEIAGDSSLGIVPNSQILTTTGTFTIPVGATPDGTNIILNGGTLESSSGFTLNAYRGVELGSATLNTGGTFNTTGGSITYGGNITGLNALASLTKVGGNTLNLTSNATITGAVAGSAFTGNIFLSGGTLTIAGDDSLGPTDDPANTSKLVTEYASQYATSTTGFITSGPLTGTPSGGQLFFLGNSTLQFAGGTAGTGAGQNGALNVYMETGRNIYITDESANVTSTIPLVAILDSTAGNVSFNGTISGGQSAAAVTGPNPNGYLTTNAVFQKNGPGILNLSGNNAYLVGGITISNGILQIGSVTPGTPGATDALGSGNITFSGGSLDNVTGQAINLALTNNVNPIFVNSNFSYLGGYSGLAITQTVAGTNGDLNLGTNTVTLNASRQITVGVNGELGTPTLTINGPVVQSNTGGDTLTKAGPGNLTLGGINTFTNSLTVNGGNLTLSGQDLLYTGNTTISSGADLILDFHGSNALPTGIINSSSILNTVAGANLQLFGGSTGGTFSQTFGQVFLAGSDSFTVVQDPTNPNSVVTLSLGSITRNPASILNITSVYSTTGTGAALISTTSGTANQLFTDPVTGAAFVTFNLTDFAVKNASGPGVSALPATSYTYNTVSTDTSTGLTANLLDTGTNSTTPGTAHATDIVNFDAADGGGITTLQTSGVTYNIAAMKFAQPASGSNGNELNLNGNVLQTNGIMVTNQVGLTGSGGAPEITAGGIAGGALEANYASGVGGELALINYGTAATDPLNIDTPIQNYNLSTTTPTNLTVAGTGNIYLTGTGGANSFTGNVAIGGGILVLSNGTTSASTTLQNAIVNYNNLGGTLIFDGGHQNGFNGGEAITSATFGGLEGTQNLILQNMSSSLNGAPTGAGVALTISDGGVGGAINTTYAGVLSGKGSLIKAGSGTFTLTGTNTYNGTTVVNAGTLIIGRSPVNGGATGGGYGGTATLPAFTILNGGTLILNTAGALGAQSGTSPFTPTGNLTINGGSIDSQQGVTSNAIAQQWNASVTFLGSNNLNLGTGSVYMTASRTVNAGVLTNPLTNTNGTAALTVGGQIVGTASGFTLTKDGPGLLALTNTALATAALHSFTGLIIADGQVNFNSDQSLGIAPTVYTAPGVNNVNDTAANGDVMLTGGGSYESSVPSPVALIYANTAGGTQIAMSIDSFRNILIGTNGATIGTTSNSYTLSFNGEIDSNGGPLTKGNLGTVFLSNNGTWGATPGSYAAIGASTFNEGIYVNAGTLALSSGNSTSASTFLSPAGTGVIYEDGGTLNTGNTTGSIGSYNLQNGIATSGGSTVGTSARTATNAVVLFNPIDVMANSALNSSGNTTLLSTVSGPSGLVLTVALNGANAVGGTNYLNIGPTTFTGGTLGGNLSVAQFNTDVASLTAHGISAAQAAVAVEGDIIAGNLTDAAATAFNTDVAGLTAIGNSPAEAAAAVFLDIAGVSGYNGNVLFSYTNTGSTVFTSAVVQVEDLAGTGSLSAAGSPTATFDFGSEGTTHQGLLYVSSNVTAASITGTLDSIYGTGSSYTTAQQTLLKGSIGAQPANSAEGQFLTFNLGALQNGTDGRTFLTSNTSVTGVSTAPGAAGSYEFNTDYVVGALGLNTTFNGDFSDTNVLGDQVFVTKVGGGTLVLTGNSFSTGLVTISSGTLQLGNGGNTGNLSAAGTAPTIAILSGGTLDLYRGNALVSIPNPIVGTGTIRIEDGNVTTFTNAASTFAGTFDLNAGTLLVPALGNGGVAGYLGASSNAAGNLVIVNGATLEVAAGAAAGTDRNFTMGNQTDGGGAILSANGTAAGSFAVTFAGPSGGGTVADGGSGLPQTLTLTGNTAGLLGGGVPVTVAGSVVPGVVNVFGLGLADDTGGGSSTTGQISLLVTGNSTWSVTGAYSNTGSLGAGNGGLLLVDSALASSPVVVQSGGTVSFTGSSSTNSPAIKTMTVNGGGNIAPAYIASTNSFNVGTLNIGSGGLTLNGGNVVAEFNPGTLANSQIDITGGGKLNIAAPSGFTLYQTGTTNAFSALGSYTLATTGGILLPGGGAETIGTTISSLSVLNSAQGFGYLFSMDSSDDLVLNILFSPGVNGFLGNGVTGTSGSNGNNGQVLWNDPGVNAGNTLDNNHENWDSPSSGLNYPTGAGSVVLFPNHTTVATTITDNVLDTANGGTGITLGGISFDSSTPYTLAGSAGHGIALSNNTSGAPGVPTTVNISNSALGSNSISAPLYLTASPVAITITTDTLTLSGPISNKTGGTGGLSLFAATARAAVGADIVGTTGSNGNLTDAAFSTNVATLVGLGNTLAQAAAAVETDIIVNGNLTDAAFSADVTALKGISGTLVLSGANTFGGGVVLNSGTLDINNNSALGTGPFVINSGSIDNTSAGSETLSTGNPITINSGSLTYVGATVNAGVTNNLNLGTGAVLLGANTTVNVGAGATLTLGGLVSSANVSVISIGSGINAHNYTTGAFGLTMAGPGSLILSTGGNYSVTTINGGTLLMGPNAQTTLSTPNNGLRPNSTVAGAAGTLPTLPQVMISNTGNFDLGGTTQTLGNITLNGSLNSSFQGGSLVDGTVIINDTHPATTGQFILESGLVTASLSGNGTVLLNNANQTSPLIFAPVNDSGLTGQFDILGGNIVIESNNPFGASTVQVTGTGVVLANNGASAVNISTTTAETWNFGDPTQGIYYNGSNALNLGPGAIVVDGGVANITVTQGTLTLSGPVSSGSTGGMQVLINGVSAASSAAGITGGGGTLVISNTVNAISDLGSVHVGIGNGSPTVDIVTGGNISANTSGTGVGNNAHVAIGELAGDNVIVNMSGTAAFEADGFDASSGINLSELSGDGGTVQSTLNISGASTILATAMTLGNGRIANGANSSDYAIATVNQNGGTVSLIGIDASTAQVIANPDGANLFLGGAFNGLNMPVTAVYNLNGGLLSVYGIYAKDTGVNANGYTNTGSATFNFNGGVLQGNVTSSSFIDANWNNAAITTNVGVGGAILDVEPAAGSSSFSTIVLSSSLLHSGTGVDGGLTKIGSGVLALVSNSTLGSTSDITNLGGVSIENAPALSTYTGPTTIENGTVQVDILANEFTTPTPSPLGESGQVILVGGTLQYGSELFGQNIPAYGNTSDLKIQLGNGTAALGGTIDASGIPAAIPGLGTSGNLVLSNPAALTFGAASGAQTLYLTGTGGLATQANGTISNPNILAAQIGNNGSSATSVEKDSLGTWELTGANTYTGPTTITEGLLLVTGSSSSPVFATSGGAGSVLGGLGGTGTINAQVNLGGTAVGDTVFPTISAGLNGTGTLTVQKLNVVGANFDYYFNGNTLANPIVVGNSGGLSLGTGSVDLFSVADGTEFTGLGNYTLIGYTGALTGNTFAGFTSTVVNGVTDITSLTVANPQNNHDYTFQELNGGLNLFINLHPLPYSWDVNAGGTWSTDGNWSSITDPNTQVLTDEAPVNGESVLVHLPQINAAPVTITIDGTASHANPSGTSVDIGALDIDSAFPYTIASTGGNGITFNNSADVALDANDYIGGIFANGVNTGGIAVPFIYVAHGSDTISAPIVLAQGLLVDVDGAADTLTLSGPISQTGSTPLQLASNGTGTLILGGTNTYTGLTTLYSGTLDLNGALAGGGLSYNGGTLAINSPTGLGTGALTINSTAALITNTSGGAVTVGTGAPIDLQNDVIIATKTVGVLPVTSVADELTFTAVNPLNLGTGGILINGSATSANFTLTPGTTVTFGGPINTANLTVQGLPSNPGSGLVVQLNGGLGTGSFATIAGTVNAASGTGGVGGGTGATIAAINAAHFLADGNIAVTVVSGGNIDATNSDVAVLSGGGSNVNNLGGLILSDQPGDNSSLTVTGTGILEAGRNINAGAATLAGTPVFNPNSGLQMSAVYNGTIAQNQLTFNSTISSTFNVSGTANVTLQELTMGKGKSTGMEWDVGINPADEKTLLVGAKDAVYATVNQTGGNVTIFGQGGPSGASLIMGGLGSFSEPSFSVYNLGGTATTSLLSTYGIFATNTGSDSTVGNATISALPFAAGIGSATFNFNGGTLHALGNNPAFMSADSNAATAGILITNVQAGGANIDTNGFSIGIQTNLNHSGTGVDGGLNVTSSATGPGGTLTLGGLNNTYNGPTSISNSILVDLGTLASPTVTISNGGLLTGTGSTSGPGAVIGGSVIVQSGGSLGSAGGGLTLNGPVTVQSGGNITGLVTLGAAAPLVVQTGGVLSGVGTYNGGATVAGTVNSGTATQIGTQNFGAALSLTGATINEKIAANDNQNDLLVVSAGGLSLSGVSFNFLTPTGSPFLQIESDIPLIEYSGTLTGGTGDLSVGDPQTGWNYSFSIASVGGNLHFIEASISTQLLEYEWNEAGHGALTALWGTSADWSQFSSPPGYDASLPPNAVGLAVYFPDTPGAPQSTAITLDNNYTVGALNFSSQQPYTLSAQTGKSLTLDGGAGAAAQINVTSGNPTLSTPVIVNADGGGLAASVSSSSILTISGAISQAGGTAGVTFTGGGTLALSGANTYAGATTLGTIGVSSGTLDINGSSAIGLGTLNINGGNIDNTSGSPVTLTTNNAQFWNSAFTVNGSNALNLGSGTVTLSNSPVITIAVPSGQATSTFEIDGALQGTSDLNKQGPGVMILGGQNGISSLVGNTNVENGNLTLSGAHSVNNRLPAATVVTVGSNGSGSVAGSNGYLVLGDSNGPSSVTIAGLYTALPGASGSTGVAGGGVIGGNALASTLTINVPAATTDAFSGLLGNENAAPSDPQNGLALTVNGGAGGILNLSNVGTDVNSYAGGTTINSGTLQASSDTVLGYSNSDATTAVNIGAATLEMTGSSTSQRWYFLNNAASALVVDSGQSLTLGANSGLKGAGSLNFTGPGTLVLAGALVNGLAANYTYAGATNINSGTLQLGTLGGAPAPLIPTTSVVTLGAASTLNLNDNDLNVPEITGGGAIVMSSQSAINNSTGNGGTGGGTGNITTGSNNVAATLSGLISGLGSLTKMGTGSLTLSGANTFSGNTTIDSGTIIVANALALQDSTFISGGTLTFANTLTGAALGALTGSGGVVVSNGTSGNFTLTVGGNNASFEFDGFLSGAHGFLDKIGAGTFTITGPQVYAGNTTVNGGILELGNGVTNGSVAANIVNNASTVEFANTSDQTYSAVISGTGGVILNGSTGTTVTLDGVNTYTGTTSLNSGNLVVNGRLGGATLAGTVNVANFSVLGGNGFVGSVNVQPDGIVAPGVANAPGDNISNVGTIAHLTVDNFTLQSNNSVQSLWHLSTFAAGSQDSSADEIIVKGILTNASPAQDYTFDFQNTGYFDGTTPNVYTLISISNPSSTDTFANAGFTIDEFVAQNLGSEPDGAALLGTFQFANNGKNLDLVVIPEPASWTLGLGAAALLLALRRRRLRQ